jgi:hypothetical protein
MVWPSLNQANEIVKIDVSFLDRDRMTRVWALLDRYQERSLGGASAWTGGQWPQGTVQQVLSWTLGLIDGAGPDVVASSAD